MAALRPAPDAPKRYIFNWAHMLVGHSAHILASICKLAQFELKLYFMNCIYNELVTTIFLAVEMEEAELRYETYWILTAHICVYAIAQIALNVIFFDQKFKISVLDKKISNNLHFLFVLIYYSF